MNRLAARVIAAAAVAGGLYLVTAVYAIGETLLAVVLLAMLALATWVYLSPRTRALRYLFPGIAAALVFVVFPMLYTIVTGFTNYSTRNLLDQAHARAQLLDERREVGGTTYDFVLAPAPDAGGRTGAWQLRLSGPGPEDGVFVTPPLALDDAAPREVVLQRLADAGPPPATDIRAAIAHLDGLRALTLRLPEGGTVRLKSLREFAPLEPRYAALADGGLRDLETGAVLHADGRTGFFENERGEAITPGFHVGVGWQNYHRIFTDPKFSEPFARIFVWTVVFAALTVLFTTALGLLLAVVFEWEALQFKGVYRLILFLPYAVPGFISILVFKGLFNPNQGEINLILDHLFGIRPGWFSDPLLAKVMLLAVNTWLGFPYMMVVCTGLIKSLPGDIYEASAVAGAGPLQNFFQLTLPLILKPLTPLLISAFAFNFNNFVLISLLTNGRPDFLDTSVPAGTTDILVSYTWRIAFQDSGQQFGLAAALSTVIFLLVAAVTLVQMHFTRVAEDAPR